MSGVFRKQVLLADRLDQVYPAVAKLLVSAGGDRVQVWKVEADAASLRPSQSTLLVPKAVAMALNMLHNGEVGGDLDAFMSSDGYILDGHHRWAATILAGGTTVGGYRAALPGAVLLRVLNLIAKGALGVKKGKPGEGSLADFTPEAVAREVLRCAREGLPGDYPLTPGEVVAALGGNAQTGARAFARNVSKMHREAPPWAPTRDQMPVIEPEDIEEVSELLNGGHVNWRPPYRLGSDRRSVYRPPSTERSNMSNDKTLRSELIRTAASGTPEVKKAILSILKTASTPKRTAQGFEETEDAESAILGFAKAVGIDGGLVNTDKLDTPGKYPVKVPKGFESLFKNIWIEVQNNKFGVTVYWKYDHPQGGSNGVQIGTIQLGQSPGSTCGYRIDY